jgi:hypothetical protein
MSHEAKQEIPWVSLLDQTQAALLPVVAPKLVQQNAALQLAQAAQGLNQQTTHLELVQTP